MEPGFNRNRPALAKVLSQVSKDPSDWNGFLGDISEELRNPYDVDDPSTLPYLLGDAFDEFELRTIARRALQDTHGRTMEWAKRFGLSGRSDEWLEGLGRSHLLQLLLTETDTSLVSIIDACVSDNSVEIPRGEVRTPMVNQSARSGAWRQRSELSSLGYRSVSDFASVSLLRLSTLARTLFSPDSPEEMDDLSWILRDTKGNTPTEQLESFLRTAEPAVVLRRLVLARRGNAERAASALGIARFQPDDDFLDVMLWKLGFPPQRRPDIRDAYWEKHDALESLSKTAGSTANANEEQLRATASNYFVVLERFLFDSLVFATWSLLVDHFSAERPFQFHARAATQFAVDSLNAIATSKDDERNNLDSEPTLSGVVQGFMRLSTHLASLRGAEARYMREEEKVPKFVKKTQLQRFPFQHKIPFLDLTASAQVRLISSLAAVGSELNASGIMTARNGLLHAKSEQRTPTVVEMNEALARARAALNRLEEIGCVRSTFELESVTADSWGRSVTVLRSHGDELRFISPAGFELLGLPTLSEPVYLLKAAIFAEPNEMLRFQEGFDSRYSVYWEKFPVRPRPGNRAGANSDALLTELGGGQPAVL